MMNKLTDTDQDILETFKKSFSHLKNEPLVLYGLGEKTKLLLDNLCEFNFVALLDKNSVGTTIFNLPVISLNDVKKYTKNIVIVCIYASKDIIFNRISYLINDDINIYYMNGEKLQANTFEKKDYLTFDDLKRAVFTNDVISFDIFDTLLLRKTNNSTGIFEIIENSGYTSFVQNRILAEKQAQKNYGLYYHLDNIYEFLKEKNAKDLEIDLEIENIYPKKQIVELFNYALSLEKKVVITSDMYLPENAIRKMLKKAGVNAGYELNISSSRKMSKYDGSVFEYYKKKYSGLKILHIGDDAFSDIEQAKRYGINTFFLPKTKEILSNYKNVEEKNIINEIFWKLDNPFSDKLVCSSVSDVGYFIAPLILNYLNWLYKKTKELNIDKILFISRDGYLLNKLWQLYPKDKCCGVYLYTSRRNLGVCSIRNKQDIIDVFEVYYVKKNISVIQFINSAYGVNLDNSFSKLFLDQVSKEELLDVILNNADLIIKNAEEERIEYQAYLNNVINKDLNIAMINLVCSGTTQYFAQKVINKNIKVFCFQTTSDINRLNINKQNLYTLYGDCVSPFTSNSGLSKHYHMLEAILTSPEEQFVKIKDGQKYFLLDKNANFKCIAPIHNVISTFMEDFVKNNEKWYEIAFNPDFCDKLFSLLFDVHSIDIKDKIKTQFKITDGFSQQKKSFSVF